MPKLSFLIPLFSGREEQFRLSIRSLTSRSYDTASVELLTFIDCPDYAPYLATLKKYRSRFAAVTAFAVTRKLTPVNHSASRRNFLACRARGSHIVFSEPEMLHLDDSVARLLSRASGGDGHEWVCGPVYATRDVVDEHGRLVDECTPLRDLQTILSVAKGRDPLGDPAFARHYHAIDYRFYTTPYYVAMFDRATFLSLGGMNQNLRVRGYEETEFFGRFSRAGGRIVVDRDMRCVHLPHPKMLDLDGQVAWNLYNSTVTFDTAQPTGKIDDAEFTRIDIA